TLAWVLVIVSAMSIQDVRERPAEHKQAADTKHARFDDPHSDFLSYLNLWHYIREQRRELSSSQFRRLCRNEFLHWLRIREWQDLHGQLRQITRELGWNVPDLPDNTGDTAAPEAAVHQSILAGLLSHIGVREGETRDFLGARGSRFAVFPGSALAKKPPRWVMAAELVETSRLWARTAGRIEPEWAEKLGSHLVKRQYSEPHWSSKRGAAMAYERVTLYGVPIVAKRAVGYANVDPEASRELFIRHALVQGEWQTKHQFFHDNRTLLADVEELEQRARRRDILVDDETLYEFYDARVPAEAVTARHFDTWWKKAQRTQPDLLTFLAAHVVNADAEAVRAKDYPDAWRQGDIQFPLTYQFEPGTEDDGVTARIPVPLLAEVRPVGFDWLVPGMRHELVVALIKTLPKNLRRQVVPAPDFASAALEAVTPRSEPLALAMARELSRLGSIPINPRDFDHAALPAHLRMTFVATDSSGKEVGRSKDLDALRRTLAPQVQAEVSRAGGQLERPAALRWTSETLGTLAPSVTRKVSGQTITGYPALVPETDGVAVRVLATESAAAASTRVGLRDLLLAEVATNVKTVASGLTTQQRLALSHNPDGSVEELVQDIRRAAAADIVAEYGRDVRSPKDFEPLIAAARADLSRRVAAALRALAPVLEADRRLLDVLARTSGEAADDVAEQRQSLVFPGFVAALGIARIKDLARYLSAATLRLESLPASAGRDQSGMDTLDRVYAALERAQACLAPERRNGPSVDAILWMIEELRVSLFAQTLGTAGPISEKRVLTAIAALT
ncbi:MAG: ATP-dependent RNA helicase HrpA, partial [Rhodococcus sp.]|nr:ATP-dependent RNA helicase HrpA [Rhodococcus sp. (in: high G+C Gram-positive bacteria)]